MQLIPTQPGVIKIKEVAQVIETCFTEIDKQSDGSCLCKFHRERRFTGALTQHLGNYKVVQSMWTRHCLIRLAPVIDSLHYGTSKVCTSKKLLAVKIRLAARKRTRRRSRRRRRISRRDAATAAPAPVSIGCNFLACYAVLPLLHLIQYVCLLKAKYIGDTPRNQRPTTKIIQILVCKEGPLSICSSSVSRR